MLTTRMLTVTIVLVLNNYRIFSFRASRLQLSTFALGARRNHLSRIFASFFIPSPIARYVWDDVLSLLRAKMTIGEGGRERDVGFSISWVCCRTDKLLSVEYK